MADTLHRLWDNIQRRKFLRTGIPLIIFVVGGSFFLKQFSSIRYEFRQGKKLTQEEAEQFGLKSKPVDVKTAREEMMKEIQETDLDKWENIRGPRPWEDSKSFQQDERQKLIEKKKHDS